jgi:hypothetical protein
MNELLLEAFLFIILKENIAVGFSFFFEYAYVLSID